MAHETGEELDEFGAGVTTTTVPVEQHQVNPDLIDDAGDPTDVGFDPPTDILGGSTVDKAPPTRSSKTGAEAWEVLYRYLTHSPLAFSSTVNISALFEDPRLLSNLMRDAEGQTQVADGLLFDDPGFMKDGKVVIRLPDALKETYGVDEIELELTYLSGDDPRKGQVRMVDDLLSGLRFNARQIETFWGGLDQGDRDQMRAALWYGGFYAENPISWGYGPNEADYSALIRVADKLLQAGGRDDPQKLFDAASREYLEASYGLYEGDKVTGVRQLLTDLYAKVGGVSPIDTMAEDLRGAYAGATGWNLPQEDLTRALESMVAERMGDVVSPEGRWGRDTMAVADTFLAHYFNNGIWNPNWQGDNFHNLLTGPQFYKAAEEMGLASNAEARELRTNYLDYRRGGKGGGRRLNVPYDQARLDRYRDIERQILREGFARIYKQTGDLTASAYLYHQGLGSHYAQQTQQGYGSAAAFRLEGKDPNAYIDRLVPMVDSTQLRINMMGDFVDMGLDDDNDTPEDIARRALISADIDMENGYEMAQGMRSLANALGGGLGGYTPANYRSVS